jgi:hypothetical protein
VFVFKTHDAAKSDVFPILYSEYEKTWMSFASKQLASCDPAILVRMHAKENEEMRRQLQLEISTRALPRNRFFFKLKVSPNESTSLTGLAEC